MGKKLIKILFSLLLIILCMLNLLACDNKKYTKIGNVGNISKENKTLINSFFNKQLQDQNLLDLKFQKINSYTSFSQMMNDLDEEKINFALVDSISANYYNNNVKPILIDTKDNDFNIKFCLCYPKEKEDLCNDTSIVIKQLKDDGYIGMYYNNFIEAIMNGSKPIKLNTKISDDYGVCKVGFTGNFLPFDFVDENDEPIGFTTAIFSELGKRLLKNYEFVKYDYKDIFKALQNGEIDCIYAVRNYNDLWNEFENDFIITESIIETPLAIVSKINNSEG